MMSLASLFRDGRRPWAVFAAAALVLVVGGGVLTGLMQSRLRALDEAVAVQEKKLASNWRALSAATNEAVVGEYREFANKIPRKGSTTEEIASMVEDIGKRAAEAGVVLAATRQRETKTEKDFEEYRVEIEIESDMKQLVGFLYGIESSAQLLRVDRMALDARTAKEGGSFRGILVISRVVTL